MAKITNSACLRNIGNQSIIWRCRTCGDGAGRRRHCGAGRGSREASRPRCRAAAARPLHGRGWRSQEAWSRRGGERPSVEEKIVRSTWNTKIAPKITTIGRMITTQRNVAPGEHPESRLEHRLQERGVHVGAADEERDEEVDPAGGRPPERVDERRDGDEDRGEREDDQIPSADSRSTDAGGGVYVSTRALMSDPSRPASPALGARSVAKGIRARGRALR